MFRLELVQPPQLRALRIAGMPAERSNGFSRCWRLSQETGRRRRFPQLLRQARYHLTSFSGWSRIEPYHQVSSHRTNVTLVKQLRRHHCGGTRHIDVFEVDSYLPVRINLRVACSRRHHRGDARTYHPGQSSVGITGHRTCNGDGSGTVRAWGFCADNRQGRRGKGAKTQKDRC